MAKEAKGELRIVKTFKDGAALFSNGMIRTGVVRLCFVNFKKAKVSEDDDGNERESYGCTVLIPKGADLTPYRLACQQFGKKELGDRYNKLKRKEPLRKQDEKSGDYDGFEDGAWFLNVTSKYKPRVTGRAKEEIELDAFYSGCYARLTLRPYHYGMSDKKKTKGNSGIGLGLAGAQFIRDGEPLGAGGVDPNDVFDAEEGEDMEMDDGDGLL